MKPFTVIIPARMASTRLSQKPLLDIAGKPMVQHVFDAARKSGAARVMVATDSDEIKTLIEKIGGEACLTSPSHPSGTDRIAEAVDKMGLPDDTIIVNLQGDEPLMPPAYIGQTAALCEQDPLCVGTVASPIGSYAELFNPAIIKVVLTQDHQALYFSRAPLPWVRDGFLMQPSPNKTYTLKPPPVFLDKPPFYRHMGMYAYRASVLRRLVQYPPCVLEEAESLEQLRALWHGHPIRVAIVDQATLGVDTETDLGKVRDLISGRSMR